MGRQRTDGDSFDASPFKHVEQLSEAPNTDDRVSDLLSLRSPYRSQADVVYAILGSFSDVLKRVARHPDDRVRGKQPPGDVYRHIRLADMHAIRTHGKGNVDTVVDEDRDIVLVADRFRSLGDSQKLFRPT